MPTTVNGRRLGVARNGYFTDGNTDPIPGGRLWNGAGLPDPGAAVAWLAMRHAAIADGISDREFRPGGPASSARSITQQRGFFANQPPPAAYPGTSNHGWGIAVDCPSPRAQAWIRRNGHRFGWSWDEGKRVGEPWHVRYIGGYRPPRRDPLAGATRSERRWIREYDRLVKADRDLGRRRVLRRVMKEQRQRIWRLAQPRREGGDGKGWTRARTRRYRSLKARSD